MSLNIAPDRLLTTTEELAAKGAVGARRSRIFRRLAVEQPDKALFDGSNPEVLRRHLTVHTLIGSYGHLVACHAYCDLRPEPVSRPSP